MACRTNTTPAERSAIITLAVESNAAGIAELAAAAGRSRRTVRRVLVEAGVDVAAFFGERKAQRIAQVERIADKALRRLEERLDAGDTIPASQLAIVAGIMFDKAARFEQERHSLVGWQRDRLRYPRESVSQARAVLHGPPQEAIPQVA